MQKWSAWVPPGRACAAFLAFVTANLALSQASATAGKSTSEPASDTGSEGRAPETAPRSAQAPPSEPATSVTVRGVPPPRSASEVSLDEQVLSAAPHRNASELLFVVPGIFVSQHSGEGKAYQIFFRGFDAVHGQDVELWAAGAPVNDVSNLHGQGYADLNFLIPEVVHEVRSSPGNYDPRQGDFAVAGSLRFELGYKEPGVTARASLGSFGARRYFMAYRPEGASEATFGAFELYATDGFGAARAAKHGSAIAQTTYDFGAGVTGRVMASTYAGGFDSAGVLRLSDIESKQIDRYQTLDPKQGGYSSRTQLVLELGTESSGGAGLGRDSWSFSPFLVLRALELRSNFTGQLTSAEGDSIQQRNDATTVGATASYRRVVELFSNHDAIEAGLSLRSDAIRQSQHRLSLLTDRVTDDEQSPGIEAEVRATDAAGYLDLNLHPVRRLSVRAGLRADALAYLSEDHGGTSGGQARSSIGAQLAKRGTIDVAVMPGLNALLSYGEGFRSPQARSLGDGETTPFTRVVSYEAGLRFRNTRRFESSLAVYRTALSDDLVFDQSTARNELVPSTSRTGIALNMVARPVPWFISNTSFTYTRAIFEADGGSYATGDVLPYVPRAVVRSDLAFSKSLGTVLDREVTTHFGSGLSYMGHRPLPYSELGRDIFLVDVSVDLRFGPVQTSIEVFNLLDADWYDGEFVYASQFGNSASLVPVRHVTVGPPRTFLWSLSLFV